MMRRKKRLSIFLAAAILLLGGLLAHWMLALTQADCVARTAFTGLDNLFHVPYEYYALDFSGGAVRVPEFLVKQLHSGAVGNHTIYDDAGTAYWFAELEYAEDGISFTNESWLGTAFGPNYRVVYRNWTKHTANPQAEDLALMRHAAESLHSGDPEDWVWQGGGGSGLTYFILIRHGTQYLLEHEDGRLLSVTEDGSFRELMETPEGGHFDHYFFP